MAWPLENLPFMCVRAGEGRPGAPASQAASLGAVGLGLLAALQPGQGPADHCAGTAQTSGGWWALRGSAGHSRSPGYSSVHLPPTV